VFYVQKPLIFNFAIDTGQKKNAQYAQNNIEGVFVKKFPPHPGLPLPCAGP